MDPEYVECVLPRHRLRDDDGGRLPQPHGSSAQPDRHRGHEVRDLWFGAGVRQQRRGRTVSLYSANLQYRAVIVPPDFGYRSVDVAGRPFA
jgi:hypothetical protein